MVIPDDGATCTYSLFHTVSRLVVLLLPQLGPSLHYRVYINIAEPVLAKRNTEHGSGLGVNRWVIERSVSWRHQNKRLRIRDDPSADVHQAFLALASALICFNFL